MRLFNCKLCELSEVLKNEKIILFGIGEYFNLYVKEILTDEILKKVKYLVDNNAISKEIVVGERKIPVFLPTKLEKEENCTVLITSSTHMYEMYQQLNSMHLCDGIKLGSFPLIMANSGGNIDKNLEHIIFSNEKKNIIKKTIHSFWFSGEPKPESYKKCIESWKIHCYDYEIIEWNMENYDYTKNDFMRQAIEKKKWAFASDYARLDVIYQMGGIYLDMDVELLRPLDCLLGNKAFFTFDTHNDIDLGTFGAEVKNNLIGSLIKIYENIEFKEDTKTMNYYCQPRFIRSVLKEKGLVLNGEMQLIDNMAFLSRKYLNPMDSIVYEEKELCQDTIAIHYFNAGWRSNDHRDLKIKNNRKLMKYINIENGEI